MPHYLDLVVHLQNELGNTKLFDFPLDEEYRAEDVTKLVSSLNRLYHASLRLRRKEKQIAEIIKGKLGEKNGKF